MGSADEVMIQATELNRTMKVGAAGCSAFALSARSASSDKP